MRAVQTYAVKQRLAQWEAAGFAPETDDYAAVTTRRGQAALLLFAGRLGGTATLGVYPTLALLNADLASSAFGAAFVVEATNAGLYTKTGASGGGAWTKDATFTASGGLLAQIAALLALSVSRIGVGCPAPAAGTVGARFNSTDPLGPYGHKAAIHIASTDNSGHPCLVFTDVFGGTPFAVTSASGALQFMKSAAPGDAATPPTNLLEISDAGVLRPSADNTQSLGSASARFSQVYAGTGTINTSDAREKTPVVPLDRAELAAARDLAAEIGLFQFLAAVAQKGDGARRHIGMTVQRAIAIMERHGLDPFAYAFICHDTWDAAPAVDAIEDEGGNVLVPAQPARPAGDRYGFRLDELLLFVAAGFDARLAALEARGA